MNKSMAYCFVSLIILTLTLQLSPNIFLEAPREVSELELQKNIKEIKNQITNFTWYRGKYVSVSYLSLDSNPGVIFKLAGFPLYYKGEKLRIIDLLRTFFKDKLKKNTHHSNYNFTPPLRYKNADPKQIDFHQLSDLLQGKKFIFYTGAGLSAASGILTMPGLEGQLKLNENLGSISLLKNIINNSDTMLNNFNKFCESTLYSNPTKAHYAIANIAKKYGCAIVTENIDMLQQRTGVASIFVRNKIVYDRARKDLLGLDVIVCVGMSSDDCGFISLFKEVNPQGVVIAIDLAKPSYLSDEDFLVKSDIQEVIPKLSEFL